MKLTKSLLAGFALVALSLPTTAAAQTGYNGVVGPNDIIGNLSAVSGDVVIWRSNQPLRAQDLSAVFAGDKIVAGPNGSTMVNLTGCNGKFTPCNQFVSSGNKVSLASGNFCTDLASVMPVGPGDTVMNMSNYGNSMSRPGNMASNSGGLGSGTGGGAAGGGSAGGLGGLGGLGGASGIAGLGLAPTIAIAAAVVAGGVAAFGGSDDDETPPPVPASPG